MTTEKEKIKKWEEYLFEVASSKDHPLAIIGTRISWLNLKEIVTGILSLKSVSGVDSSKIQKGRYFLTVAVVLIEQVVRIAQEEEIVASPPKPPEIIKNFGELLKMLRSLRTSWGEPLLLPKAAEVLRYFFTQAKKGGVISEGRQLSTALFFVLAQAYLSQEAREKYSDEKGEAKAKLLLNTAKNQIINEKKAHEITKIELSKEKAAHDAIKAELALAKERINDLEDAEYRLLQKNRKV